MKKIELHVHLDESIRPTTVTEILNYDINDVRSKMMVTSNTNNLTEHLTKFDLPIKAMQTKDNLKRIAKELALDLKDDDFLTMNLNSISSSFMNEDEKISYTKMIMKENND